MSLHIAKVLTSDRLEMIMPEVDVTFSGAPTFASKAYQNGTNGKLTVTSIKGSAIGNATTVTFTMSTNAASIAVSGYGITVDLHKDGTNAFSDTTASNVVGLITSDTNVAALVTAVTNTAGIMATAAAVALTGGDDKMTVVSSKGIESIVHNSKGDYTITLHTPMQDTMVGMLGVDGTSALSNVARVETKKVSADTVTVRMAAYDGTLVDPSAACSLKGFIVGASRGA
jgi:hypothetical protein